MPRIFSPAYFFQVIDIKFQLALKMNLDWFTDFSAHRKLLLIDWNLRLG